MAQPRLPVPEHNPEESALELDLLGCRPLVRRWLAYWFAYWFACLLAARYPVAVNWKAVNWKAVN